MNKIETHYRYRKQTDGCWKEGTFGDWVKKVKGLEVQIDSYKIVTGVSRTAQGI